MKKKISVAADWGASGGKMAKGYFDGKKVNIGDYLDFVNDPVSLNGNLYWDLFRIYQNILQGMRNYSQRDDVVSVGVDTWGASYGFLDKKGRLLEPIYHYRDMRTKKTLDRVYQILPEKKIYELTGCRSNRSYTLPQLFSYVEHEEHIIDLADKMLFLPDLLEYFLSGEISTERSIAGTSGLMRPEQDTWAEEVFDVLGLPKHIIGQITNPGRIAGYLLKEPAEISQAGSAKVISVCGHDTASAVVGIPGFGIDQVYVSIGTNVNMGIELTQSIVNEKSWNGGMKNAGLIDDRKIFYKDFAALWLLNELRRNWKSEGREYSYDLIMKMAEGCKSRRVYVDTEDIELNNPGGDIREKINAYLRKSGQEELETDAEFVRCIFESVALKVKRCTEYLKYEMGLPVKKISVVNGGSRNYVLMQIISDALGMPIYAGMPYATLAGNILTQFYALGEMSSVDEIREVAANSFKMREYQPDIAEAKRWDEDMKVMIETGVCR